MRTKLVAALALAALVTGCGTSQKKTANLDLKPNEAQKIYFEGVSIVTAAKSSNDKCSFNVADNKDKNWKVLVRHASACAKTENWRTVELIAEEMAKTEINSPWSPYFHSLAAERTGDFPRAVWMIELAMKKAPGAALFHYQKGRVLWQLKDYKESVNQMSTAVQLDGKLLDAHVFLAQTHHRNMNYEKAATHYQQALTVESSHPICLQGLADVRMAQGKPAEAVEILNTAVSKNSSSAELRLRLAQAYEATEKDAQALEHYKAVRAMGKTASLGVDVNEKIKTLESKMLAVQNAQKQAKLQEESKKAQPANERLPTSSDKKGAGK
jgi:tetratricopeptide (TPR) repeat protein